MISLRPLLLGALACALTTPRIAASQSASPAAGTIERGNFRFAYDERGIPLRAHAHAASGATLKWATAGGRGGRGTPAAPPTLSLTVTYRDGADTAWTSVSTRGTTWSASPDRGTVTYTSP